jgi:hypothetical protein
MYIYTAEYVDQVRGNHPVGGVFDIFPYMCCIFTWNSTGADCQERGVSRNNPPFIYNFRLGALQIHQLLFLHNFMHIKNICVQKSWINFNALVCKTHSWILSFVTVLVSLIWFSRKSRNIIRVNWGCREEDDPAHQDVAPVPQRDQAELCHPLGDGPQRKAGALYFLIPNNISNIAL